MCVSPNLTFFTTDFETCEATVNVGHDGSGDGDGDDDGDSDDGDGGDGPDDGRTCGSGDGRHDSDDDVVAVES
jgi:hypothetical protein